jgi:SPX domain protein involved in polyphosphate accumulation
MRFGKQLSDSIYPPWKDKYLDYSKIKKLLREEETSPQGRGGGESTWTEKDEESFVHELATVQLEKVHKHQLDTANALRDRTTAAEQSLQRTTDGSITDEEEKKRVAQDTIKELDNISKETTELRKFSRVNYTGFLKAAKKHDRRRGQKYRVRPLLQVRLAQTPFNSEDYQPLLFRLSAMYTWARQVLEGEKAEQLAPSTAISQKPKETYQAYKFWVHQDNLLEVKTYILRRLPVLVYNPQSLKVVDSSSKDPTITSIYFDNDKFELYQAKVDKTEDAGSLRLRWSGQLADKPEIVLEKKVVSEEKGSSEIRIPIKQKYIQPFLKGEYKMEKQVDKLADRTGADSDEVKSLKNNIEEIQNFVNDKGLEPVLRAVYTRTAFQIPGDDRIRISLDTDLALIREDALDTDRPCRDPDDWHRSDIDNHEMEFPFSSIKKGEIDRFEHALLEIKVKDTKYTRNNVWLADLMSSHLVKEAPSFSKFVHGVAELFEDYVNSFPFWLSDLEIDIRRDPQAAFQEEQDRQAQVAKDQLAVGSFLPASQISSSKGRIGSIVGSPSTKLPPVGSLARSAPKPSQLESTAEQRDSDDDGLQGDSLDVTDSATGGIRSFLPFSNSRYARRHRQQGQQGRGWEDAPLPPGVEKPDFWIKDQGPLKVEAKVWLANQRTFVKWQHIAILLATLSLGLFNAAGQNNSIARGLAVVYTAFAVFAGCWGWGLYLWRSKLITERSGKDFDNMIGPFVVSLGLAAALCLNFGFKYSAAIAERDEGRGGNATVVWDEL